MDFAQRKRNRGLLSSIYVKFSGLQDIAPCVNYSSARSASRTKAAKEASAKAQQAAAAAKATVTAAKTASPAAATGNAGGGGTSSATAKTESKPILKTGPNAPTPTIAGAADSEKHITFLAPSPYNEKPEQVDISEFNYNYCIGNWSQRFLVKINLS